MSNARDLNDAFDGPVEDEPDEFCLNFAAVIEEVKTWLIAQVALTDSADHEYSCRRDEADEITAFLPDRHVWFCEALCGTGVNVIHWRRPTGDLIRTEISSITYDAADAVDRIHYELEREVEESEWRRHD